MTTNRTVAHHATDALAAERCIVELQRGREAVLFDHTQSSAIALVDMLTPERLGFITAAGPCQLVLSAYRARVLGRQDASVAAVLNLPADVSLQHIQAWAGLTTAAPVLPEQSQWQALASDAAVAGLKLAQQAHALPALLTYPEPIGPGSVMSVSIDDALGHLSDTGKLISLSRTRIPLAVASSVELAVFKECHGSAEHVAITVGHPDLSEPVIVRLHSSCFTGDILGSLRCDCGEQLTGAINSMVLAGGGVILYLSQEGRGIGLASKLRAYQLQDEGLDTIEANQTLGFGADERHYQAATTMLRSLGIERVKLMTNNPLKIDALRREGVDVVSRLPSHATVNVHNARYLETKRKRAGHLLTAGSAI
jgi:GTP cyclohydrolase II